MIDQNKLAGLELFEGLSGEALGTIASISREMSFEPGQVIFSPELQPNRIFLLVEGQVRLTVHASPLPEPVTVAMVETPGQAFGFSSVVGQGHHNSSAEAAGRVKAVAIEGPAFLAYLESDPVVGFVVMTRLARVISRRLAALRRLLLETIIDYERPTSTTPEN